MPTIRNSIITQIAEAIFYWEHGGVQVEFGVNQPMPTNKEIERVKQLLSTLKGLAIVDRQAKLPQNPQVQLLSNKRVNPSYQIYAQAQRDMRVNGWVKELVE